MIEIKEINKRFEDVQAVSDLTMKIVEGEILDWWEPMVQEKVR